MLKSVLGLSTFAGCIVFLVLLIKKVIKRQPKKFVLIGLAVCFTVFCCAVSFGGNDDNPDNVPSTGDIVMSSEIPSETESVSETQATSSAATEEATEAPTEATESPTTVQPTTPPTTEPPTTEPPATEPPTAAPTTTEPPTTVPPTTQPPSTVPPTEQPTENPAIKEYVLNTNTMKFHKPNCRFVKTINESHRQYFTGTREEVLKMGYEPCGNCHP